MEPAPEQVTQILNAVGAGDPQAAEKLLPLVYEELRKLAAHRMANEAPGQTLQPTALVHEAWLRLVRVEDREFQNRAHFFAAAAEAMRRILVEKARRKHRLKHGGGQLRMDLSQVDVAVASDDETVLAVSDALDKLASRDPQGAKLIQLRFFAGLSNAEAGEVLGLPERTAKRTWAYARAWLHEELKKTL
jgi:RNA polymerase sigma factor (TIGR02999 family)